MAIFKCKMCGGDLEIEPNVTVCECDYCGTKQTVPTADNEKKLALFSRAGRLLRNCAFDKASGVFESIVAEFPEEAEAYWGLVLCKYGIEYVDDPATGKKIPTCHRSSFDSVLDDSNFEQACENTDAFARRIYRDEARTIEELRKDIIEVSGKEEPYDVFVSYKETAENGERTLDSVIAQDIYKELTNEGYRVFFSRISLEDKLGTEYEPYIFAALNSAKVMIVVGTDYENYDAVWVKNEWSRFLKLIASGQKKTLIPVYKNMDAYDMPKEFAKLAAQDMGKVGAMQDLLHGVEKLIPLVKNGNTQTNKSIIQQSDESIKIDSAVKRGYLALEDGEWEKAKQFFDQALNLDAECARAYFGIALADFRAKNAENFIQNVTKQTPMVDTLSIPEDHEHIQKAVEVNSVGNYLSVHDINALFKYELTFPSQVRGQQEIQYKIQQQIDGNRNLSKAVRFSRGKEKDEIEGFKKTLFDILQANVDNAQKAETINREKVRSGYASFIKDADSKVQERHNQAIKEQQRDYDHACEAQHDATTIEDYQFAIKLFEKTGGYRDADTHIIQCKSAITNIEEENRLNAYETASDLQLQAKTVTDFQSAISAFRSIAGYKDTDERIIQCEKAIIEIKEEERKRRIKYIQYASGIIGSSIDGFAYVNPNGTVVSRSSYRDEDFRGHWNPGNTAAFSKIKSVVCTEDGIVGLRDDGTCVATKPLSLCPSHISECNSWTNIAAITAGAHHVVGLKKDGTCVANSITWNTGYGYEGQSDVSEWRGIVAVACGSDFSIGLKRNGQVVYTGNRRYTRLPDVNKWNNIELIAASGRSVVGLTKDGQILSMNALTDNIDPSKGIVQLMVVLDQAYALYVDGTVGGGAESSNGRIAFPFVKESNIVSIFGSPGVVCALTEDGRILTYKVGYRSNPNIPNDIRIFESYDQIVKSRFEQEEEDRKEMAIRSERREKGVCLYCGGSFKKTMFSEKCISCGRKKDY